MPYNTAQVMLQVFFLYDCYCFVGFVSCLHESSFCYDFMTQVDQVRQPAAMRCQSHIALASLFYSQSCLRLCYVDRMPVESSQVIRTNVFQRAGAVLRSSVVF